MYFFLIVSCIAFCCSWPFHAFCCGCNFFLFGSCCVLCSLQYFWYMLGRSSVAPGVFFFYFIVLSFISFYFIAYYVFFYYFISLVSSSSLFVPPPSLFLFILPLVILIFCLLLLLFLFGVYDTNQVGPIPWICSWYFLEASDEGWYTTARHYRVVPLPCVLLLRCPYCFVRVLACFLSWRRFLSSLFRDHGLDSTTTRGG